MIRLASCVGIMALQLTLLRYSGYLWYEQCRLLAAPCSPSPFVRWSGARNVVRVGGRSHWIGRGWFAAARSVCRGSSPAVCGWRCPKPHRHGRRDCGSTVVHCGHADQPGGHCHGGTSPTATPPLPSPPGVLPRAVQPCALFAAVLAAVQLLLLIAGAQDRLECPAAAARPAMR